MSTIVNLKLKTVQSNKEPPRMRAYSEVRTREYLLPEELTAVIQAAGKTGRYPVRDQALILVCYRHALRVGELVALRWEDIDLKRATLLVRRLKGSDKSLQYLDADELRLLRKLGPQSGGWVFVGERGTRLAPRAVHKIVARAGELARLPFPIHPHMLRHTKGYQLANRNTDTRLIQAYLGHRNIQNTVKYTALNPTRFRGLEQGGLS